MVKHIILGLFVIGKLLTFGQNAEENKKLLTTLFKNSLTADSKAKGWISSEKDWMTCNKDSFYYKSDTVVIYNNSKYYNSEYKCYDLVCWSFYNQNSFRLSQYLGSRHPAPCIVALNNFHKIKLKVLDNSLFLKTYVDGKIVDNFKVVSVLSNGNSAKLTLVRIK